MRNFFPQVLMTLPFLRGGGKEILALTPPTPNAGQSPTFHKKPGLQSFLKMRWRLLPSPAPAPSPSPPPPGSSPRSWPRRPNQAGRRPQAHSSSHCHAAEIKDTSSGWAPAKRFKSKSGRGGPGPELCATCKGCLEGLCPKPLGGRSDNGRWGGGCHIRHPRSPPPPPGVPNALQNPRPVMEQLPIHTSEEA